MISIFFKKLSQFNKRKEIEQMDRILSVLEELSTTENTLLYKFIKAETCTLRLTISADEVSNLLNANIIHFTQAVFDSVNPYYFSLDPRVRDIILQNTEFERIIHDRLKPETDYKRDDSL